MTTPERMTTEVPAGIDAGVVITPRLRTSIHPLLAVYSVWFAAYAAIAVLRLDDVIAHNTMLWAAFVVTIAHWAVARLVVHNRSRANRAS